MAQPPERILIACMRLIGDVILATPLLGALHQAFPNARIDFLVNRGTGGFLAKDPRVSTIHENPGGLARSWRAYLRPLARTCDWAFTLNTSDRGMLAVALAGRRARFGPLPAKPRARDAWKRAILTPGTPLPAMTPAVLKAGALARAAGLQPPRLEVKVCHDHADAEQVHALLRARGLAGQRFFVLHPFSRYRYKDWEPARYATLSDHLATQWGLAPVWTGSPDPAEKERLAALAQLPRHKPALLAGELTLNQLAALLQHAVDTAVSHIAAASGVPMAVLFGPTFLGIWGPWRNEGPPRPQYPPQGGTTRNGRIVAIQRPHESREELKIRRHVMDRPSASMQALTLDEVLAAIEPLKPRP